MPSDSEVVSVDDLRPGQDYYIVGTSWGKSQAAPAVGAAAAWQMEAPAVGREKASEHRIYPVGC